MNKYYDKLVAHWDRCGTPSFQYPFRILPLSIVIRTKTAAGLEKKINEVMIGIAEFDLEYVNMTYTITHSSSKGQYSAVFIIKAAS